MQKEAKRVLFTFANQFLQSGCGHSCSSCPNSAQCHKNKNELEQQNVDIASTTDQQQDQQIQKSNIQDVDTKENKYVQNKEYENKQVKIAPVRIPEVSKQQQNSNIIQVVPTCKHLKSIKDSQLIPTLEKIQQAAKQVDELKRQQYAQQHNINPQDVTNEQINTVRLRCTYVDPKAGQCTYAEEDMWLCLHCFKIFGGNYHCQHAQKHFEQTKHPYAMHLYNFQIWCFKCVQLVNYNLPVIKDLQQIFYYHQTLTQWSRNEPVKQEKVQQQIVPQQRTQNLGQRNNTQQPIELYCQQISDLWWQDFQKYDIKETGKVSFNKATCYAIAVIHMLAHIDCFSNYFITFWAENNNDKNNYNDYQFTSVLQKYIQYVKSPVEERQNNTIDSNELAYAINQLMLAHFQAGEQQDANEFLQVLFDHLTYRCKKHADICFSIPTILTTSMPTSPYVIYISKPSEAEQVANKIFYEEKTLPYALIFVIHQIGNQEQEQLPEQITLQPKIYQNCKLSPYETQMTKQQLLTQYYISQMAKSLSINIINSYYIKNNIEKEDYYWPQLVKFLQYIFISFQNEQCEQLQQILTSAAQSKYKTLSENLLEKIELILSQDLKFVKNQIKKKQQIPTKVLQNFINQWEKNNNYFYNFDDFDIKMFQSFNYQLKSGVFYSGNGQAGHYISRVGGVFVNGGQTFGSNSSGTGSGSGYGSGTGSGIGQGIGSGTGSMTGGTGVGQGTTGGQSDNSSNTSYQHTQNQSTPVTPYSNYQPYIFAMERQNSSNLYNHALYIIKNQNAQQVYKNMCNAYNAIIKALYMQPLILGTHYYKCPALILYYLCQLKQIPQCDYRDLITDEELVKYSLQPFQDCGFIKINGYTLLYLQSFANFSLNLTEYIEVKDNIENKVRLLDSILQNKYKDQQSIEHMPYILSMQFVDTMIKELILKYQVQYMPANYDLFSDPSFDMRYIKQNIVEFQDYISISSEQEFQIEKYYEIYPIEKALAFKENLNNQTIEGSIIESSDEN